MNTDKPTIIRRNFARVRLQLMIGFIQPYLIFMLTYLTV